MEEIKDKLKNINGYFTFHKNVDAGMMNIRAGMNSFVDTYPEAEFEVYVACNYVKSDEKYQHMNMVIVQFEDKRWNSAHAVTFYPAEVETKEYVYAEISRVYGAHKEYEKLQRLAQYKRDGFCK